jgi:hypothetical protein
MQTFNARSLAGRFLRVNNHTVQFHPIRQLSPVWYELAQLALQCVKVL